MKQVFELGNGPEVSHEAINDIVQYICQYMRFFAKRGKLIYPRKVGVGILNGNKMYETVMQAIKDSDVKHFLWELDISFTKAGNPVKLSNDILRKIVTCLMDYNQLPELVDHVNHPFIRPDGTICDIKGYDKLTGIFIEYLYKDFPSVPENPTREDAIQALDFFRSMLADFPFETETDFSAYMSLWMTCVAFYGVRTVPAFAIIGNAMGSGKTLLSDAISILKTGKTNTPLTLPNTDEEYVKLMIAQFINDTTPVVTFDNVSDRRSAFKSDAAASILTSVEYKGRILRHSKTATCPCKRITIFNGNHLEIQGDLTTRTIAINLHCADSEPYKRKFSNDFRNEIECRREEIIIKLLTIHKAYYLAGKPEQNLEVFGRFEEWSDHVRNCLVWLGLNDPCETMKRWSTISTYHVDGDFQDVLHEIYAVFGNKKFAVGHLIKEAEKVGNEALLQALMKAVGTGANGRIIGAALGRYLTRNENFNFNSSDFKYSLLPKGNRSNAKVYCVIKK